MNKVASLTKENFWNELKEKYPNAVDEFCLWIDDYKADVNWKDLFSDAKFHDMPFDMQIGILIWYIELKEGTMSREDYITKMRDIISQFFADKEPKDTDS